MSTVQGLVLSSLTGAVVGAFGILVAVRKRKRGSDGWVWLVHGVFGALLCILSIARLVGATA